MSTLQPASPSPSPPSPRPDSPPASLSSSTPFALPGNSTTSAPTSACTSDSTTTDTTTTTTASSTSSGSEGNQDSSSSSGGSGSPPSAHCHPHPRPHPRPHPPPPTANTVAAAQSPLPDAPSALDSSARSSIATGSATAHAKQRPLHSRILSLGRSRSARQKVCSDTAPTVPPSSAANHHHHHHHHDHHDRDRHHQQHHHQAGTQSPRYQVQARSQVAPSAPSSGTSSRDRSRSPSLSSLRSAAASKPKELDSDRASTTGSNRTFTYGKLNRLFTDSPIRRPRSSSSISGKLTESLLTVRSGSDSDKSRQPRTQALAQAQAQSTVTGNSPLQKSLNMHQTSSRLLRMTDDDRPFTRDFKDLFSTLMVSLPLTPHRVRFSKIEHTFTTDEAITNLGSLKFSQSNRMPDPKDPSRIVTTTTTTTFSMAKEMARSVCHKFLEARFVESCESKSDFLSKSSVWQLTPKGMRVLTRFCTRNGIHQRHVNELLDSPRNMMQLVILERDAETDKINNDRAMIEVIFRRFAGETPNVREGSNSSDTDSLSEYATGLVGVRCIRSVKPAHRSCPYIFTGKAGLDWLIDCCMVVDRRECLEIANLFMMHDLINQVPEEKDLNNKRFQPVKTAHYHVTERGAKLAGWTRSPTASVSGDIPQSKIAQNAGRDSNTNRMTVIVRDPALRLLFREFLIDTHCEENLTFYLEVKEFLVDYSIAKRASPARMDLTRENLASAYSLYNAFLAPGSPCELNIDHNLRNALAGRMTRAVGEDSEMQSSLDEVAVLFDQAQTSVFKLMASDSVPKFSRDPKYATVLRDRNLEHLLTNFDRH